MTTEAKIRDAFEKKFPHRKYDVSHHAGSAYFNAGYIALLNELEFGGWYRDCDNAKLYALPEGVTKS